MRWLALSFFLGSLGPLALAAQLRDDQAAGSADAVAAGQAAFAMCAGCHGQDGHGVIGVGPRLNSTNYLAAAPNSFFEDTLKKGRAGTNMVAFGASMPQEQVDALVAYIRSWQTTDGIELDESPLTGSTEEGEQVWNDICSRCHGRSGAGYSEAGSGTGIGRADFLDVASNGFLRAVVKNGKDNTQMKSFSTDSPISVADLTDQQIDSVIKYLRANAW